MPNVTLVLGTFVSPSAGSNYLINAPQLAYNSTVYTVSRVGPNISFVPAESVFYGPSTFATALPIKPQSYLSLQFDYPVASKPSALTITFIGGFLALDQHDFIDLYLPRVQSVGLMDELVVSSVPNCSFTAIFRDYDSTLRLYSRDTVRLNTDGLGPISFNRTLLTIKVGKLLLPDFGIDAHVVQALKVSTNSSLLSDYNCPHISE